MEVDWGGVDDMVELLVILEKDIVENFWVCFKIEIIYVSKINYYCFFLCFSY